jgi:ribosomal subunit interface protein
MQIDFTARRTEIPPRLRAAAERKLKKLARDLRGITHAHFVFSTLRGRQIAEVTVQGRRRLALRARDEGPDLAAALATAMDKLTRQARRHLGKRQERKRESPGRPRRAEPGTGPGYS